MPRKVSKRSYRKRPQKARRSRKRFYRRRFYRRSAIKKPEIHILETNYNANPFNDSSYGVGAFQNLTSISQVQPVAQYDTLVYKLSDKTIDGKKIRLKYLYIKGYIKVGASTSADADDFNCKLMVFRRKRNMSNMSLDWETLINNSPSGAPSAWTEDQRLDMMYKQDWKNDIKINFYKRVKNLYRKYDDANNIIPFKIRVPLYDCVLSCDCYKSSTDNKHYAHAHPSTNGLYFTFLSNKYDDNTTINYKVKLYYTDY